MSTTLVVMAAGMGSRFGGLKQMEPITDDGKVIVDFSVFDAVRTGFDKIVFIVRKDIEKDFRDLVGKRIEKKVEVDYVLQDMSVLPIGRTKPLGTGQAVLCCKNYVKNPFVIINADDYYGVHAFDEIYRHLQTAKNSEYAMTAYELGQTVSTNGTVTRGVCKINNGFLTDVTECYNINCNGEYMLNDKMCKLSLKTPISMNLWGLTTDVFDRLDEQYFVFLKSADLGKDEFLIPTVISNIINQNKASVKVYKNSDKWYGITYRDDLLEVKKALNGYIKDGLYDGIW